jgi:hypothetical protein
MGLCNCAIEDITRVFVRTGVNDLVDAEEGLAFAMALITELYSLSQGSAVKAKTALDEFHAVMQSQFEQQIRARGGADFDDRVIDHCMDSFFSSLRVRYPEYREIIRMEVLSNQPKWFVLSHDVLCNLFGHRLSADQRDEVLVPLALQLAVTIVSCMDVLFPTKRPQASHPS